MAQGYFNDGTVNLELGYHVFALPAASRRIVMLDPHSEPASILDSGGGILDLEVSGSRVRARMGDAERYIYEIMRALAESGPGDLAFEDNRGHQHVYGDAVCTGAVGVVRAFTYAELRFRFACPEKSAEPPWIGVPATPAVYAGTDTLQDYQADGISLGVGGVLQIELVRAHPLRQIPRARGARASVPESGAVIRFMVKTARVGDTENLATDLEDLARSISGVISLTGNGNTFSGVLLEQMQPRHTDWKHTMLESVFVQNLADGNAWSGTTTTEAPTTTTTTAGE